MTKKQQNELKLLAKTIGLTEKGFETLLLDTYSTKDMDKLDNKAYKKLRLVIALAGLL